MQPLVLYRMNALWWSKPVRPSYEFLNNPGYKTFRHTDLDI